MASMASKNRFGHITIPTWEKCLGGYWVTMEVATQERAEVLDFDGLDYALRGHPRFKNTGATSSQNNDTFHVEVHVTTDDDLAEQVEKLRKIAQLYLHIRVAANNLHATLH